MKEGGSIPLQSQLQRFVSRDPIGLEGGTNLYIYSSNQPCDLIDPLGLQDLSPTDEPGPPVPPYTPPSGPSFPVGNSFSECVANCFEYINFLGPEGLGGLWYLGGPIPKSWAKAWGYRVASAGGKTKFTGVPSLIAQRRKMPSGNWLRNICKYANKAWFAYGGYLVVGELWCLSTCDERHPGCEEIKKCEGMNP